VKRRAALLVAVLPAGCATWSAPGPDLAAELPPAPPAAVARDGTVDIESPGLSGLFTLRAIARSGSPARVRLQLFPDLGGKVLDVAAGPDGIAGTVPYASLRLDRTRDDPGPPELLLLIGLSLLEEFTPLEPARVTALRRAGGELQLRTHPLAAGLETTHVLRDRRLLRREFRYRGASWRIVWASAGQGTVDAPGVRWRIAISEQPIEPPPDATFRLAAGER
jgi:hypothetical protein